MGWSENKAKKTSEVHLVSCRRRWIDSGEQEVDLIVSVIYYRLVIGVSFFLTRRQEQSRERETR